MWKNIVQPARPQITIGCMRISRRTPKATTYTFTIRNTYEYRQSLSNLNMLDKITKSNTIAVFVITNI